MSSEFVRRQIQNLVQEEVGDNHPFTWEHSSLYSSHLDLSGRT